jgi:exodeoxyribonuclease-3
VKIATYNVNSIRRRLPIVLEWLEKHEPDVMCLQETKVQDDEFPALVMEAAGYYASFRGMKAYNGVAMLSKKKPERVLCGLECGNDPEDVRILMAVLDGIPIVNTYVPQGYKIGTDKYAFKLEWFRKLRTYFEQHLDPEKPALWVGDLNVAPEPIDVYHPDRRVKDVDFHIDARNAYKETASWGFVDVFRKLHPDRIQYTYWDYFRNAFENNWGWRIDHIMATVPLAQKCRTAEVDMDARRARDPSDHTVMWAEFDV